MIEQNLMSDRGFVELCLRRIELAIGCIRKAETVKEVAFMLDAIDEVNANLKTAYAKARS